jgi:hypothetical protein
VRQKFIERVYERERKETRSTYESIKTNAKRDSKKEEDRKARKGFIYRVRVRKKGKKLEGLMRVCEQMQKGTARKKKDWKRIKSETEIH